LNVVEIVDPISIGNFGRSEMTAPQSAIGSEKQAMHRDRYVFDNAAMQTAARFRSLAAVFDPGTVRHLTEIGVTHGWNCLEIGAGGGTVAGWLCDRVGAQGHVMATDIDTQFLKSLAKTNLDVCRHDIAVDPLPEAAFDLVHVRLVLVHLRERDKVLSHIVSALKPGGWLLAEEFDSLSLQADPAISPTEMPIKALSAMKRLMASLGVDSLYGRRLSARVRALGLVNITAEGRMFMWEGRSIGADLIRASLEQVRGEMIELGLIHQSEFERDMRRLDDSELLIPSPIMWAVSGRRPCLTTYE
jgi:SAM-dependent methyltransferase